MHVELLQMGSCPVAVVRRRASAGDLAKLIPEACGIVWNVVRQQKLTGAGRHLAIYWDDEINLEVGVEMNATFPEHGEVKRSATPAGLVATVAPFWSIQSAPRGSSCHSPMVRGSQAYIGRPELVDLWALEK